VVVAVLVYGQIQLRRSTSTPGPRIAVIQGDYPLRTVDAGTSYIEKAARHYELLAQAAQFDADLYLLPETPWMMVLNKEYLTLDEDADDWVSWSRECFRTLQTFASQHDAYVVTGAMSKELTPLNMWAEEWTFNSAFVIKPDGSPHERYDKVHVVLFGEMVPFRFGHLRFLYVWFNSLSPFGAGRFEYSLTPGREFKVFEMQARTLGNQRFRFGIPICYEDVMPYISRRFVIGPDGRKRVDFLLNISNDGWFLHSNELPQHLAICAFRAVENRVGIARAVNTGISGFIDADGRIHDLVTDGAGRYHGPGIEGYRVASIDVDSRCSLYSRAGDWFAIACCVLCGIAYVDYLIVRTWTRRP
jgi:apolipoprotein N-acyltransferase